MRVTARLSQLFYDRLGEQIATEPVDWFNAVDATYRADLRELNELNFARFDAKLEQRIAELRAELARVEASLSGAIARLEARLDTGISRLEAKLGTETARLEGKLDTVTGRLEAKIDQRAATLAEDLERGFTVQGRWLMAAWASLLAPMIGLMATAIGLLLRG